MPAFGNILTIAAILLLLVVIFAFGVVSLQCCFNACRRRRAEQAASSPQSALWWCRGGGTAAVGVGGGDPELLLLRSLPAATVYRAAPRSNKEDAVECVVCLAGLEDGDVARFLPCCNHGFHAQCVDTWLASQSTCPLCRIKVVVARSGMAPPRRCPHWLFLWSRRLSPPENLYAANLPTRVLLGLSELQGAVIVTTLNTEIESGAVSQVPAGHHHGPR